MPTNPGTYYPGVLTNPGVLLSRSTHYPRYLLTQVLTNPGTYYPGVLTNPGVLLSRSQQ